MLQPLVEHIFDNFTKRYCDIARAKLRNFGSTPKIMDEHEVAATMDKTDLGIGNWRFLVQYLKIHLGFEAFVILKQCYGILDMILEISILVRMNLLRNMK